jgi:hypothetical protein
VEDADFRPASTMVEPLVPATHVITRVVLVGHSRHLS